MKIENVRLCGFERLYNAYVKCYESHMKGFSSGLNSYLSHAMISLELSGISGSELFYLKSLASNVTIIDIDYIESLDNNIDSTISELMSLHNQIINDDDINCETCFVDNILPIGCQQYHVIATFNGSSVISITGMFIDKVFIDDNGNFFEVCPMESELKEIIAKMFYKSFYEYISNKITNIDIVTEFMLNKDFYNYADEICLLSHVNTPLGQIEFFGNTDDKLSYQVNNINKNKKKSPYFIKEDIYLTFTLNTTFSTFLKMYLNTNYVTDFENLKVVFTHEGVSLSEDIDNKYGTRISSCINKINEYKKQLLENTSINLNLFNFIFNGNKIKYSIRLSFVDIENFLNTFENIDEFDEIKESIKKNYSIISTIVE